MDPEGSISCSQESSIGQIIDIQLRYLYAKYLFTNNYKDGEGVKG